MTTTRRSFLRRSSASLLALSGARSLFGQDPAAGPVVRIACVGLNSRGKDHIEGFRRLPGARVVALVDVDSEVLGREVRRFTDRGEKVLAFADVRRVLERDDVDAISIATPNHWHALMGIWACQAGKDVYVEKPVSHDLWEGRQLVRAARKYGRIVQAGTQCRSSQGIAAGIAWVQAQNLGRIELVRGLCYKPRPSIGKTNGPVPVPASVDYDLWCGPAPKLPLRRQNLHYDWHWDFATGNGDLGNQGIHQMDLARWVLGATGLPKRTRSLGGRLGYDDDGNTPNTQVVLHDYDQAPLLFEVRGLPHDRAAQAGDWGKGMDKLHDTRIGVLVHCEGGVLRIPDYTRAIAYDAAGKEIRRFEGSSDHYANFLAAVQSRQVADLHADIEQGHLSSALCHLGNLSQQCGAPATQAAVAAAVAGDAALHEATTRMLTHLAANGVDLDRTPLSLGPWLDVDAAHERVGGDAAARQRGSYRDGFVVPEIA
ncbi:MAG: Gfo/Idh/MocA family oxidoreductase [Planctomycetes bacterium]|nr:Gfo/Idh/MocA family oxidoreductase [Planctomycetota bacterium]MCC7398244.1 Gfo/Idh/MocA family oxidoreductase [Planctomycetota bacterium]